MDTKTGSNILLFTRNTPQPQRQTPTQSKPVELLDKDLLINLNAAIKNADLGKEGSKTALQESVERESISKTEAEIKNIEIEAKATYQITVHGEKIKFEDRECKDIEELKSLITQYCSKESELILQDNYAETHVYQEVLETIRDMQEIIGFSFVDNNT